MFAPAMKSPGTSYAESMEDTDDIVYPCRGCGEILEEGKAFELAGNRWHINCFRCNTCSTLLDSDANLLLLGDGTLICNNCTYSCNACGDKIEDLAILTGDQAFCASCFRCRNCKRKIENLRYARTTQGIFCMSCYESLMARRRKRAKGTPRQGHGSSGGTTMEKALPSLPPSAASSSAFSPGVETPASEAYSDGTGARSPAERQDSQMRMRRDASPQHHSRNESPMAEELHKGTQPLPSTLGEDGRPSNASDENDDDEEQGFLPMAFDPNPVIPPNNLITRKQLPRRAEPSLSTNAENKQPRDYFGKTTQRSTRDPVLDALRDGRPSSSHSGSVDHERDVDRRASQIKGSPHIAYQDVGRTKKKDTSGASTPNAATPGAAGTPEIRAGDRSKPLPAETSTSTLTSTADSFKLQDLPDRKLPPSSVSRNNSKTGGKAPLPVTSLDTSTPSLADKRAAASPESLDSPHSGINPFDDPKRRDNSMFPAPPPPPASKVLREDTSTSTLKAKSPEFGLSSPAGPASSKTDRRVSTSSIQSPTSESRTALNRKSLDGPPPRAPGRTLPQTKPTMSNEFVTPRAPPPPPLSTSGHKYSDSMSTMQSSDGQLSPGIRSATLPKHNPETPFSMEEEMARILRGENNKRDSQATEGASTNVLRRVSNVVKHGRSFSDRGLSSAGKLSASHDVGSLDISAPIPTSVSPATTGQAGLDQLRAQLKRANQRIAELEAEKSGLQDKVDSSAEIKAASNELREKRNTMVVLDTQREIVVAELESMTAHLKRAKDSGKPVDWTALKTDITRDFADALQRVKDNMARQIEDLIHKRNELTDEIGTLIQMKDKGFQEYESLSAKNAQLVELNGQLVQNIQGVYKANANANGKLGGPAGLVNATANGLGIHPAGFRSDANTPVAEETEAEPAALVAAPQVVNIRKGQPKKFNWRKGGEKMAKNVTKGLKGAFVGEKTPSTPYGDIGMPYNFTQVATGNDQPNMNGRPVQMDPKAGSFGFFGQKGVGAKGQPMGTLAKNTSSSNLIAAAEASVLFGSELDSRCEYERRLIPSIISRCIEEVEHRGMDVEGIYRKSGGSGQVKSVQHGFEKDPKHDISDSDLDIHAVTSALKQYFRKLPTPLITYDAYDPLLEAAQTQDKEKQIVALRAAIEELPDSHRNCLEYLIQHLTRVISHEAQNLMTPLNIAVVFAPTIMRPRSIEREMSDMQMQRMAVQALLEHHQDIFGGDE